ncbi:hypothetical protein GXP70_13855 [Paenibacillus lycopersici]|uniref:Adenylyl-sulfate kinase n=1 Tax=Paenibacillus lycopersici TaxID=2704462 RepID=A0A6C0G0L6_9BACL|nr:hypothetical protein [Paenibacillus lycopersici]QHT60924.1 hypothetical protein GXP70_13855 [Paenibacillus lycopersici]
MHPKLVLIEGLPGSGKSTTARLVHELLGEKGIPARLYTEGNPDHPADYEGAAWFEPQAFERLLQSSGEHCGFLARHARQESGGYVLEYRKLQHAGGFPADLLAAVSANDIYELPFAQNRALITNRWRSFAERAMGGPDNTFVFECCFIQNPVTVGMIKHGEAPGEVASYVAELASIVEPLNPLLLYVDQDDLDHSFRKAVAERPKEWADGFMAYYTGQGYGREHGCEGLEGTIRVLEARRRLEADIYESIPFGKLSVNNSCFDPQAYRQELQAIVAARF